uniref:rRNA N-glycosylase n=1 Tax=Setaria viridis TaxID=4556 RepID=A0A4U6SWE1_SETVI|nr:uncharacterized protein LOC117840644 isoform X2 [Setaria viridis]XP_034577061.1 uncharacterized protein LOC117840654 isoform X2 [Setaria viridis]TKV93297.1 hypothetical protein SEVIR_9G216901v2 [Setaria viridis]TKV93312.1 hypothetical protein SEVIR_9G217901v2 [Setaria viridis]
MQLCTFQLGTLVPMGATRVVLAIVVLVLNVAAGSGAGEEEWYEPCSTASFHLDTHGYMSVFGTMKTWIFDHRDKDPIDLAEYENPKLTVQDLKNKPLHWFIPLLMGEGTASTNLAFRSDNLYLSGFTNQKGKGCMSCGRMVVQARSAGGEPNLLCIGVTYRVPFEFGTREPTRPDGTVAKQKG